MKSKLALLALLAGTLAAPAFAQTTTTTTTTDGTTDRSSVKTFVKDSAITTKIKAKLATEKLSSLATIQVDTDADGMVWLSGTARTQDEIDKAVMIAKATESVRGVKNDITVKTSN